MEMNYPEGATPLDPDELEGLKYPHIETRAELDELEQHNIQEGYFWLNRQRKYKDYLTEGFLIALHEKLFGSVWNWAGSFRRSDKNIGVHYLNIGLELRNLLDDAKYWVENDTYKREEFAAKFHHRLVWIHPFPNGNGRHGRIVTDVILERVLGVSPIKWDSSELGKESRTRKIYIDALHKADCHDYQPLIEFVTGSK